MILLVDIISYLEMCAEHVVPRSASAPALSVSTFFIIFFSKYARARAPPAATRPKFIQYEFPIILKTE